MMPRLKPQLNWREFARIFLPSSKKYLHDFEQAFAMEMGAKHAIAFPYGRTALYTLLQALGLEQDEIICPAYTCVVVPHAIVTSGNVPLFIDSQSSDFNMDLQRAIEHITPKTKALMVTSLFGYPVNLEHLDQIKRRYPHVHIIQDCAHSFNTKWHSQAVNKVGCAAIYGLNVSKLMTSVFGGMLTTDDDDLAAKVRDRRDDIIKESSFYKSFTRRIYLLAVYGALSKPGYALTNYLERSHFLNRFVKYYDEQKIDMPADYLQQMTPFEAGVGLVQLNKYQTIIQTRRQAAYDYHQALSSLSAIQLPPLIDGATYSHYVPRVLDRPKLLDFALSRGIQLGQIIEYAIPYMSAYRQYIDTNQDWPVAKRLSQETINLPIWSTSCVKPVVTMLQEYFSYVGDENSYLTNCSRVK